MVFSSCFSPRRHRRDPTSPSSSSPHLRSSCTPLRYQQAALAAFLPCGAAAHVVVVVVTTGHCRSTRCCCCCSCRTLLLFSQPWQQQNVFRMSSFRRRHYENLPPLGHDDNNDASFLGGVFCSNLSLTFLAPTWLPRHLLLLFLLLLLLLSAPSQP